MKIISHRGYWKTEQEKNSVIAFKRSFDLGFGTETDFRDNNLKLVIEHDLPINSSLLAENFFTAVAECDKSLEIAINVKSDGLQDLIIQCIEKHQLTNCFLFDMSVPDAMVSIKKGLRAYTRQSEFEPIPAYYSDAVGVWMDAFIDDDWITPQVARKHIDSGKKVCIVSPEIHNRPYKKLWSKFRESTNDYNNQITLCTDFPEIAAEFFKNEKD